MKFLGVILLIVATTADRLDNTYLPPSNAKTAGGSSFLNAPKTSGSASFSGSSSAKTASSANNDIGIVRLINENNGDGTYNFDFETENHITHQESGQLKTGGNEEINSVQGQFSFLADDGNTYSISYTADENGFRPEGAHLPTAPPIPEEILKALEQNAADEAAGIVDDGQYRPEHQGPAEATGSGSVSGGGISKNYLAPKPSSGGAQGYRY